MPSAASTGLAAPAAPVQHRRDDDSYDVLDVSTVSNAIAELAVSAPIDSLSGA